MRVFVFVCLLALLTGPAAAKEARPLAEDPAVEKQVQAITSELRCLVCQNQTIADSHADLAIDLKNQVREMVKAGKSRDEIVAYMVQRYGDFVLYRPPVKPTTWLLWAGPFLLFVLGLGVLVRQLRKRARLAAADEALDEAARARAQALLQGAGEDEKS